MTKAELLKYAEHGVRERLREIQLEMNSLAKLFPHIVGNQDGSVPAVLPLSTKAATTPAGQVKQSRSERLAAIRAFLQRHPGATTQQIGEGVGLGSTRVLMIIRDVAKLTNTPKARVAGTWVLKGSAAPAPVNGRPAMDAKRKAQLSKQMRSMWANMSKAKRTAHLAKLALARKKALAAKQAAASA